MDVSNTFTAHTPFVQSFMKTKMIATVVKIYILEF